MPRFDRYLLSQLIALFGFFALVLVSVYWINQAVRLFDQLIGDGQSAMVFLEFSALTLPNVIGLVLPMAVFAAAVYVTNRLSSDSELVVMQATGFSPWRLARPVAIFGLLVALMMSALTHYLIPVAQAQMKWREAEISRNVTARLLSAGTFLHPAPGVTFYIGQITPDGTLRDVFLSDRRSAARTLSYTAAKAYLVNADDRISLVMVDGLSQNIDRARNQMFTTHFQDFSYDISDLIGTGRAHRAVVREIPTAEVLRQGFAATAQATGQSIGRIQEEIHSRFHQPLLAMVAALIGFSTLLIGGFSRFGVWRQIVLALVLLVVIKGVEGAVITPARADPRLWPLIYLPFATGVVIVLAILAWVARPRRPRGPPGPPAPIGAAP